MTHQYRLLRSQTHTARVVHNCDYCSDFIFPGDQYELNVSVITAGRYRCLRVAKTHLNPQCPPDDREGESQFRLEVVHLAIAA